MVEDTRKAKVILQVEEKGAKEAARSLGDIGDAVQDINKDFKRVATDGVEALADTIRRDLNSALDETAQKAASIEVSRGSGLGGGGAPAAAKFRGVAGLVGGEGAASVVGIVDDLQDAFEGLSAAAKAAPGALASAASALGPVGLGLAAVAAVAAAAFIAASQDIQKEAQAIEEQSKARLSLSQRLPDLTQSEATAELERNAEVRKNLQHDLALAEKEYNEFLASHTDLEQDLLQVFDAREDKYAKAIDDANAAIASLDADSKTLSDAMAEGRVKADEVTQAEQKLAEVRTTESKKSVETAVKAEAARAREVEKSQQEQQKRIASAIASIKKHNDAIRSASDAFSKATADIARQRKEGEFDIRTEMGRDLDDITLKNTQDVTKAIKEDWRNARDDAFKNADEIADIRSEGRKAEQEAIREGDFKQLFLAREATKERLAEEAKTDERERQLRELHLEDTKDDLKTSLRQEQDARRTAGIRAFEDLKLNLSREMTLASEARSSEFAKFASHYNRMAGLQQQYINRVEGMLSGGRLSGERMARQPRLTQQIGQIIRKS